MNDVSVVNDKQKSAKSLFHSASIVSGMTLISRIVGFIRDMVFALIFGASASMDAFYVAF